MTIGLNILIVLIKMREEIVNTIMAVIMAIIAGILVWVCNSFTVPTIAAIITVTLCGIAGWGVYRVSKMWILKLIKSWNSKRKQ